MTLPTDFQFSQGSLQDYVDCPRRFELRHVERRAWPAVEAEPAAENERHLRQGAAFHRLTHQHTLGIPPERLSAAVTEVDLARWWRNYLAAPPADLPPTRYAEVALSAPLAGYRLVAMVDLVAVEPRRRVVLVDWKTYRRRPRRTWLADRLQTRVYPYLLVRAGSHFNDGEPVQPEQVQMVYWFANFPSDPETFVYSAAQYEADEAHLTALVEEIGGLEQGDLPLTSEERHCLYCPYRSLCQRGVEAGSPADAQEEPEPGGDFDLTLDFEQIAEVEY
jgi:hypothetical protein